MSNSTGASGSAAEPTVTPPARRSRWWVAVITFVLGAVGGVVAVGLLVSTTPDFVASPAPGGGGTAVPTSGGPPSANSSVPVVAEARVNAACLRVINDAQDVYVILTGVGEAVVDVDLQQLDDIVRQLQPVEARLANDLPGCNVDTNVVVNNPDPSATPSPGTPQPTASAQPTATAQPTAQPTR